MAKTKVLLPGMDPSKQRYRRPKRAGSDIPAPAVPAGEGPFEVIAPPPSFAGGGGMTERQMDSKGNVVKRVLSVPFGMDREAVAIRTHEYAHLEYDRELPFAQAIEDSYTEKGLTSLFAQAGADVMVNALASQRGLGDIIADLPLDDLTPGLPDATQALWMLRKMSTTGGKVPTSRALSLDSAAKAQVKSVYAQLVRCGCVEPIRRVSIPGAAPTPQAYLEAAYESLLGLQRYFEAREEAKAFSKARSAEDLPSAESLATYLKRYMRDEGLKPAKLAELIAGKGINTSDPSSYNVWGSLTVHTSKFDRTSKRKGAERVAGFAGGFRSAFRLLLPAMDGRAWAIKRRRMGGTILIDHSGSMRLSPAQIQAVLMLAPLATIACYSGNGRTGNLHILAKNGRYTSETPGSEGGNVVDGPSLQWLSRQPAPRVWISDGGVTGHRDRGTPNLVADAYRLARMASAVMFPSIESYMKAVGALKQAD